MNGCKLARVFGVPSAVALVSILCWSTVPAGASTRHHHHRHHSSPSAPPQEVLDLSPVAVEEYDVTGESDPKTIAFDQKLHLENGIQVRATRLIGSGDVTNHDLYVLDVTQSFEGGFDSVNMYDRGVLSWGIMQWAAHSGSLDHALLYIRERLVEEGRAKLWQKTFKDNGLDVDNSGLIVYGKAARTIDEKRLALRGSTKPGDYDPKLVAHWATVFARAGRQAEIERLQCEYAGKIVQGVIDRRLDGLPYHLPGRQGASVADLTGSDPFDDALIFALWTNNPKHAWRLIYQAAEAARALSFSDDPSQWTPGAFDRALLNICCSSTFGTWAQRGEAIRQRQEIAEYGDPSQLTPYERDLQKAMIARSNRQLDELASRHQAISRPYIPVMEDTVPATFDDVSGTEMPASIRRALGTHGQSTFGKGDLDLNFSQWAHGGPIDDQE